MRDDEIRPYRERCAERHAELVDALARIVAFAERTPDVARVVVFGSFARNSVSPWSDLDILVVRDGGPPDMVDDIYRACGVPGDVIGVRTTDYPGRVATSPFGRDLLADGRSVYARPA